MQGHDAPGEAVIASGRGFTGRSGSIREGFEAEAGFELDPFQRDALDALDAGEGVVVAAPTGSGKTVVAEYAVCLALAAGGKAFYTTPLKALSNQKYAELVARHGTGRVGLLTGDNALNPSAPVVVMTTEVLRNMIYAGSGLLSGLRYVILDEVHYLQNAYRGPVWEEVIVHAPAEVALVCLSATVSNATELADWIRTVRGATTAVVEQHRPVALHDLYLVNDRGAGRALLLPTLVDGRPNPEAAALDRPPPDRAGGARILRHGRLGAPSRTEVVELLAERDMLPALYFVFSRKGCDDAVGRCRREGLRLTTAEERRSIRAVVAEHVASLDEDDLRSLDYPAWLAGLEAGLAAHHAGLIPPFKEAVEACFALGAVKVVFATETLSLGINMPARSVVIDRLTKFTGERHQLLTAGEYAQLTGRAGRRGIDEVGFAVVPWSSYVSFEQVAGLAGTSRYSLTSSFRPTYNMAVNLVRRYPPETARHLLGLSFAQYQADAEVVRLEARLERVRAALADARRLATCERGDVAAHRAALASRASLRDRVVPDDVARALGRLRPGDVVILPGRRGGERVAVLTTSRRRGGDVRVRVITSQRRVRSVGPAEVGVPVRAVGRVPLPSPYAPRSAGFQRRVASALASARLPGGVVAAPAAGEDRPLPALGAGPVGDCPDVSAHLRALERAERLEREAARLEGAAAGRAGSVAAQFDRVLGLLVEWGYVEQWSLTERGERLARLYHEADLLVVEALEEGIFDGLDAGELAAVASMFTFEARRAGPGPTVPAEARLRQRWVQAQRLARRLNTAEDEAGVGPSRFPDPGLAGVVRRWAAGGELSEVLGEAEISGGDFVRNVKQLVDLLHQLGAVAPEPSTAATAVAAADHLLRGVVATSSVSPAPAA